MRLASQTISGTLTDANPGSTVEIFDNAGVSPIASASIGVGGAWSTTVTLVGIGTHSLVARGTDLAGNIGISDAVVFDYAPELTQPTLGLSAGSDNGPSTTDGITGIVSPGFSGTADPGALVTLREGATVLGTATANAITGFWQIASVPLSAGTHSLTATATEGVLTSDPGTMDVTIDLRLRSGTAGDDRFTYTNQGEFLDPVRWVDGLGGTDRLTLTFAASLADADLSGLSNLERLVLSGGGNQSVVLGSNAAVAFGSQIVLSATASTLDVDASGLGTGTALVAYGTTGMDELTGGAGNDRLYGYAGDDALVGGLGSDVLDGGLGADLMTGGAGADLYYVDNAGDGTVELAGGGYDRIVATLSWLLGDEFERLSLSGTADIDGTGNALANQMDGNAGANRLEGGAGDDRLLGNDGDDTLIGGQGADVLHGGLGADRMEGGSEDDLYYVDDAGDVTVELAGGGYDRIAASVSWSLGDEFERLSLRGTDAIDGTGNAMANRLEGNAANNYLDGGIGDDGLYGSGGDDTLVGGEGADRLHGGAGADVFVFDEGDSPASTTPARAYDIVSDFVSGIDSIDLSTIDGGGLAPGAYGETTSALSNFTAVSAAASAAMASGSFQVVFVASLTNGWLFWNTDGDATTAEQAVRLDGLNGTALFAYEDLI